MRTIYICLIYELRVQCCVIYDGNKTSTADTATVQDAKRVQMKQYMNTTVRGLLL
jgi:hypothetical protein